MNLRGKERTIDRERNIISRRNRRSDLSIAIYSRVSLALRLSNGEEQGRSPTWTN
jgi:hypothetical protein